MKGSAEAIGLQVLPILGTTGPAEDAAPHAAALGRAFQLTNFLRDIDEDLLRQRVYLPADELAAHDVDRDLLMWCHDNRRTDPRVRDALAEQHDIARQVYRYAAGGIALLAPRSRPCVATALTLYSEILDRIEDSDFAVFSQRATVGNGRRLRVAGVGLLRSWRARLRHPAATGDRRSVGVMDRWQYLIVLARAWRSPCRWRSSAPASTVKRGGRCAPCCPSRRCSCSGTRWRSARTCGDTTRRTSPA